MLFIAANQQLQEQLATANQQGVIATEENEEVLTAPALYDPYMQEILDLKKDFNAVSDQLVSALTKQHESVDSSHEFRLQELKALAKYVAEGVLYNIKLRHEPPDQNIFNIDNIRNYSSLGFIRKSAESLFSQDQPAESTFSQQHELDCSLFVAFMSEVMNHLKSAETEESRNQINYMLSVCLASLFVVGDPRFKWELSWIQAFLLKSITHSAKAVDLLYAASPGGVSNGQLWDNMNSFIDAIMLQGFEVDGGTTLLIQFDNVGIYRPKQRSASADKMYQVSVVTSVMGFHLIKDSSELIQKFHKHSPLMWKARNELKEEEFQIEGTELEKNILYREIIFILTRSLEDVVDGCDESFDDPVVLQPARPVPIEDDETHEPTEEEINLRYPKVCNECGTRNGKRASHCGNKGGKDGGCGAVLPTMPQMKAALATCEKTKFLTPSKRKHVEVCNYTEVWVTEKFPDNKTDSSISTIADSYEESTEDSILCVQRSTDMKFKPGKIFRKPLSNSKRRITRMTSDYGDISTSTSSAIADEPSELLKVEVESWPCVMVNPNDQIKIKFVVDEVCRLAKVRDFVPDDKVEREFVFIGSDNGARIQIDQNNSSDSKYRRVHIVPGIGHEFTNLCQMVYDMGWNYGLHHHAELAGLGESDDVWQHLRKGKDTHRMMDFLINTSLVAHAKAFAREFLQEWKLLASPGQLPSVSEFIDYLKDDQGDVTFKNGRDFWLFEIVPAISLMVKSQRNNFKAGYDAGKKKLWPLCFVRNHHNYGRDIMEDVANDIRATPEVKMVLEEFFTILGEGFDYRLEARNKEIEANVQGTPSERSYQNAALSSGLFTQLNSIYSATTDAKARAVSFGRKQHAVDAADSNIQCELYHTRLWKKDKLRTDLRSYDNRVVADNKLELPKFKLLPNADVQSLLREGMARLRPFIQKFIRGEDQKFPRRIAMTEEENKPKTRKRRMDASFDAGMEAKTARRDSSESFAASDISDEDDN